MGPLVVHRHPIDDDLPLALVIHCTSRTDGRDVRWAQVGPSYATFAVGGLFAFVVVQNFLKPGRWDITNMRTDILYTVQT